MKSSWRLLLPFDFGSLTLFLKPLIITGTGYDEGALEGTGLLHRGT